MLQKRLVFTVCSEVSWIIKHWSVIEFSCLLLHEYIYFFLFSEVVFLVFEKAGICPKDTISTKESLAALGEAQRKYNINPVHTPLKKTKTRYKVSHEIAADISANAFYQCPRNHRSKRLSYASNVPKFSTTNFHKQFLWIYICLMCQRNKWSSVIVKSVDKHFSDRCKGDERFLSVAITPKWAFRTTLTKVKLSTFTN